MDEKEFSEKIKNELTIEQIYDFLMTYGGNPTIKSSLIMSQTICHGGHSHKLYYYDNTKLFRCYTECSESFDIYELVLKIKSQEGTEWTLPQAISFIINFFNIQVETENSFDLQEECLEDWKIFKRYEKQIEEKPEKQVDLKFYNPEILTYLPRPRIIPWEKEGITREVMNHCGICYDPIYQGIVIPHYNKDNLLVGIRERTLIKENEEFGKYRPAILDSKMYNHPLGFNLYNLNNSKDNIKTMKKVFVFEGEKSCLLYQSYFGIENDISVAVCGSSLINYQVQLLKGLGVEEIIIAFDKQFQKIGDMEWKGWTKKLKDIHKRYGAEVQISYIFDKKDRLQYKDSPIDQGPEIFLQLFKERVIL